jgi:hypothetical protein
MSAAKFSARCSDRERDRRRTRATDQTMSRIGKKPVAIPPAITANVEGQTVKVKGPKGALEVVLHDDVDGQARGRPHQGRSARRDQARARAMGHVAHADRQSHRRRHQGLRAAARDQRRRLPRRGAGQEPAARARLQPRRRLSDPGRHHDRDAAPVEIVISRHRQAEGRPGRRRNPRIPAAGALQGQGHQICRRTHLPQGRQEEVTEPPDEQAQ